jgi:hypothetical protein
MVSFCGRRLRHVSAKFFQNYFDEGSLNWERQPGVRGELFGFSGEPLDSVFGGLEVGVSLVDCVQIAL